MRLPGILLCQFDSGIGKYTKDYANLPERYLQRKSTRLAYKSDPHPAFRPKLHISKVNNHSMDRPWCEEYWRKNDAFKRPKFKIFVEPIAEEDWMWFRGDRVEILVGPDKGKQGYVNYIVQERNWVCVEGLNCEYEVYGREPSFPGVLIKREKPLLVTHEISLVDPSSETASEFEWRFTEEGERVRVSKASGHILPIPSQAYETADYKTKAGYAENADKDTRASLVEEITFEPKLATFEMEIMQEMKIKETNVPKRSYWY